VFRLPKTSQLKPTRGDHRILDPAASRRVLHNVAVLVHERHGVSHRVGVAGVAEYRHVEP